MFKSEQPHDGCKCAHELCKSAYEARHNESRRGKITIEKKTVLKAKSACQAAPTRTHKVEPSGSRDGDFCKEPLDENKICEKAIKKKTAKKRKSAWHGTTTTKNPLCSVNVLLAFKAHDLAKYKQNQGERHPTWSTWLNNKYIDRYKKIQQSFPPTGHPVSSRQGLLSVRATSPTSWGELIISRVSCSPHSQLSRPMP